MSRDFNRMFSSGSSNGSNSRQIPALFSLNDFPPINAAEQFGNGTTSQPSDRAMINRYHHNGQNMNPTYDQLSFNTRLFASQQPQPYQEAPQQIVTGRGTLTWLSAKAGLITTIDDKTVSFQLKDFCDQNISDLTTVLRVGFTLQYNAAHHENKNYTATSVTPMFEPEPDTRFKIPVEIDLESVNPTIANAKDSYSPNSELSAIMTVLGTFQRNGSAKVQLSSLHSQMSNYGDEKLFRYVGSSSMKRRNFIELRTHMFILQNDDSITLQYPAVYNAVYQLAYRLLICGGVTSIQLLFDFYMSKNIAQEIRDFIGTGRQDFLQLLASHPWVFALFPNRIYVSVRRNLPDYDYDRFIELNFPHMTAYNRRAQRTMSVPDSYGVKQPRHNGDVGTFSGGHVITGSFINEYMTAASRTTRPTSLGDSQLVNQKADVWNPWNSSSVWSNGPSYLRQKADFDTTAATNSLNESKFVDDFKALLSMTGDEKPTSSVAIQAEGQYGQEQCNCQCRCGRGRPSVIGSNRDMSGSRLNANNLGNSSAFSRPRPLIPTRPRIPSVEDQPVFQHLFRDDDF